jgi:hypothetical protein
VVALPARHFERPHAVGAHVARPDHECGDVTGIGGSGHDGEIAYWITSSAVASRVNRWRKRCFCFGSWLHYRAAGDERGLGAGKSLSRIKNRNLRRAIVDLVEQIEPE